VCSRRAGKTYCVTRALVRKCLQSDGCHCVYIALTRSTAELLVWLPLQRIDEAYGLGIKFHHTKLRATFPNGSVLEVTGCPNKGEIEKLRGFSFSLVVIDEAASFPMYVEQLIKEVLEPALEETRGTLMLIGTPSGKCAGYFYDVTSSPDEHDYSLHHWTVLDNPRFGRWYDPKKRKLDPDWKNIAAAWLEKVKAREGEDNPVFIREYLGIWARSHEDRMYHIGVLCCGVQPARQQGVRAGYHSASWPHR
jgi:hypothetical protein